MNKIKVAFVDFWSHFDQDNFILTKALRENHIVEILQNPQEADYVFFSLFGEEHWFLPDRCVKIFYTGENVCPDFNACDYAVGFEWLTFGDRYLRLPNNYCTRLHAEGTLLMEKHEIPENPEIEPSVHLLSAMPMPILSGNSSLSNCQLTRKWIVAAVS